MIHYFDYNPDHSEFWVNYFWICRDYETVSPRNLFPIKISNTLDLLGIFYTINKYRMSVGSCDQHRDDLDGVKFVQRILRKAVSYEN